MSPFLLWINDSHGIIVARVGPVLRAELHLDGDIVTPAIDHNIDDEISSMVVKASFL